MARVLIIESDTSVREKMIPELQLSAHQILVAATLSDGVYLAQLAIPDTVIMTVPRRAQDSSVGVDEFVDLFPRSRVVLITTTGTVVERRRDMCVAALPLQANEPRVVQNVLALVDREWCSHDEEAPGDGLALSDHDA